MVNSLGLIISVIAVIVGVFVFLYFVPINLWITAIFSGVRVGLLELIFMRIRKVPPSIWYFHACCFRCIMDVFLNDSHMTSSDFHEKIMPKT